MKFNQTRKVNYECYGLLRMFVLLLKTIASCYLQQEINIQLSFVCCIMLSPAGSSIHSSLLSVASCWLWQEVQHNALFILLFYVVSSRKFNTTLLRSLLRSPWCNPLSLFYSPLWFPVHYLGYLFTIVYACSLHWLFVHYIGYLFMWNQVHCLLTLQWFTDQFQPQILPALAPAHVYTPAWSLHFSVAHILSVPVTETQIF